MTTIKVIQGDILTQDVDAIVNPANGHLRHGGGLARIIDQAAQTRSGEVPGPIAPNTPNVSLQAIHKWREDHNYAPLIATGNAHLTSAGMLPFKGVIHAVGPIWNGGQFFEDELLYLAHQSALELAAQAGYESVAFPAISCGIFGYPVRNAAPIAMRAARKAKIAQVSFVLFEDAHYAAYNHALNASF